MIYFFLYYFSFIFLSSVYFLLAFNGWKCFYIHMYIKLKEAHYTFCLLKHRLYFLSHLWYILSEVHFSAIGCNFDIWKHLDNFKLLGPNHIWSEYIILSFTRHLTWNRCPIKEQKNHLCHIFVLGMKYKGFCFCFTNHSLLLSLYWEWARVE